MIYTKHNILQSAKALTIFYLAFILLMACQSKNNEYYICSEDDLHDKYVGVVLGSADEIYVSKNFNKDSVLFFNTIADMMNAVSLNKCDAGFTDESAVDGFITPESHLGSFVSKNEPTKFAIAFNKKDTTLCNQLSNFILELKESGELEVLNNKWKDESIPISEKIASMEETVTGIPLQVGVLGELSPYDFYSDGKCCGAVPDLVQLFGKRYGYKINLQMMNVAGLITSLSTGQISMIASCFTVTPEREKKFLFSEPFSYANSIVIVKSDRLPNAQNKDSANVKNGLWEKLKDSFIQNVIVEHRYRMYLSGLYTTIIITFGTLILGTLLGALLCYLRMSKRKSVQNFALFYIGIMRGTPVLVFLMIMYYIILAPFNTSGIIVACITFAMNMAAFVGEMMRGGIESIDKGQTEAGLALGFTQKQTFIHIVLPQVVRNILPVYKGEAISQLKATAIVGYIAIMDLTKISDLIRSRTFSPFFPLIFVALIYLLVAWGIGKGLDAIAKRV